MAQAALAYLGVRAVTVLALLTAVGSRTGRATPGGPVLLRFDGAYYRAVAAGGYPRHLPETAGVVGRSTVAFFPGYPALLALAHGAGAGWSAAALLVSTLAGLAAAVAIALLAREVLATVGPDAGRAPSPRAERAALLTVVLWACEPAAFVLSLAYSEALYTALAAGALLALVRGRWAGAGLLAVLAGLTRPSGIVLLACAVAAAVPVVRAGRRSSGPAGSMPVRAAAVRLRPLLAVALAPLGLLGYVLWVGLRVGRLDAWSVTESQGWRTHVDGGLDTLHRLVRSVLHPAQRPAGLAVVGAVVGGVLLLGWLLADVVRDRRTCAGTPDPGTAEGRQHRRERCPAATAGEPACVRGPLPDPALLLAVYAAATVVLALGTANVFSSLPRFLLPAFPLVLPLARRLARWPTAPVVALSLLAAAASATAGVLVLATSTYPP